MEYSFEKINPTEETWKIIESTYDATIDKTKSWLDYLEHIGCHPFIVEVRSDSSILLGYFVGEFIKKVITILGSPLEGFSTAHQGLSMLKPTPPPIRLEIYRQLAKWIFHHRYAMFIQIEDWQLTMEDLENSGIRHEGHDTSWIDLRENEETIFRRFSQKSCRYMINKAIKNGVTIRETSNVDDFLDIHYAQHQEVMLRKGMNALKPKENFRTLIKTTHPQNLLLLEAVSAEGKIISTGIYSVGGKNAHFLSRASFGEDNKLNPNELIMWEAMKLSKARGAEFFNNSGVGSFKLKFGSFRDYRPRLLFTKYNCLIPLRNVSKNLVHKTRFLLTKFGIFVSK